MDEIDDLTVDALRGLVRRQSDELTKLRKDLNTVMAVQTPLLSELTGLREAHRHCWHDNAEYLCEGETCGDELKETE